MRLIAIALAFTLLSCASQQADYEINTWNSIFDYSRIGSRSFQTNPFVYSRSDLNAKEEACKYFSDNRIKLVRLESVILSSQTFRKSEQEVVASEKFQWLLNQEKYGNESQRDSASYLIGTMERALKAEVQAGLDKSIREMMPRFSQSGANAVLVGDYYGAIQPACPDVFSFEKELVYQIDGVQKP